MTKKELGTQWFWSTLVLFVVLMIAITSADKEPTEAKLLVSVSIAIYIGSIAVDIAKYIIKD
jgi:hypothetical protein